MVINCWQPIFSGQTGVYPWIWTQKGSRTNLLTSSLKWINFASTPAWLQEKNRLPAVLSATDVSNISFFILRLFSPPVVFTWVSVECPSVRSDGVSVVGAFTMYCTHPMVWSGVIPFRGVCFTPAGLTQVSSVTLVVVVTGNRKK